MFTLDITPPRVIAHAIFPSHLQLNLQATD
jgi:hypothetical protein